jgi:hypothetical protein
LRTFELLRGRSPLVGEDRHHGRVDPLVAVPERLAEHALGAEPGLLASAAGTGLNEYTSREIRRRASCSKPYPTIRRVASVPSPQAVAVLAECGEDARGDLPAALLSGRSVSFAIPTQGRGPWA